MPDRLRGSVRLHADPGIEALARAHAVAGEAGKARHYTDRALAAVGNITDEEVAVGGIDFNNLTGFLNEPRLFGVQFKATF